MTIILLIISFSHRMIRQRVNRVNNPVEHNYIRCVMFSDGDRKERETREERFWLILTPLNSDEIADNCINSFADLSRYWYAHTWPWPWCQCNIDVTHHITIILHYITQLAFSSLTVVSKLISLSEFFILSYTSTPPRNRKCDCNRFLRWCLFIECNARHQLNFIVIISSCKYPPRWQRHYDRLNCSSSTSDRHKQMNHN